MKKTFQTTSQVNNHSPEKYGVSWGCDWLWVLIQNLLPESMAQVSAWRFCPMILFTPESLGKLKMFVCDGVPRTNAIPSEVY
jgi:hypothetical protein